MTGNKLNDVERLRDEARKRRSAVTAKIARIRRNTGVDISGKSEDPRRDTSVIKRYNSQQLRKYISELNSFQSRSVGFVAGVDGSAIPRLKWAEYKRLERKYNSLGKAHENRIGNVFLPTAGMTLRQREAMLHPTAIGEVASRPYTAVDRVPSQVKSSESLDKLIKDLKRRTTKEYLPGEIKKSRKQLSQMLKTVGANSQAAKAKKLTDSQFDTLWNYTNFATLVSLSYELAKMRATNQKERWHDSVLEDSEDELGELFTWAQSLPTNTGRQIKNAVTGGAVSKVAKAARSLRGR